MDRCNRRKEIKTIRKITRLPMMRTEGSAFHFNNKLLLVTKKALNNINTIRSGLTGFKLFWLIIH